jgi:hypothetical protein
MGYFNEKAENVWLKSVKLRMNGRKTNKLRATPCIREMG